MAFPGEEGAHPILTEHLPLRFQGFSITVDLSKIKTSDPTDFYHSFEAIHMAILCLSLDYFRLSRIFS